MVLRARNSRPVKSGRPIMRSYPTLGRFLAATLTAMVLAAVLFVVRLNGTQVGKKIEIRQDTIDLQSKAGHGWTMYGGSPQRNMVNTQVKGLPAQWDVSDKTNIKWVADL